MQPKMKESTVRIPSFDACVWFKLPVQRFTLPLLKWKIPKTKECSLFFLAIPSLNQPCLFHPNPFQVLKSQIQGWSVLVNFGQIIFLPKFDKILVKASLKQSNPIQAPNFHVFEKRKRSLLKGFKVAKNHRGQRDWLGEEPFAKTWDNDFGSEGCQRRGGCRHLRKQPSLWRTRRRRLGGQSTITHLSQAAGQGEGPKALPIPGVCTALPNPW